MTTERIDLTLAADARGVCPQCRSGHLTIEELPVPTQGRQVSYRTFATCAKCNYSRQVFQGQIIDGVGTVQ